MKIDISEYKYKIETHCHTSPASTCSEISPEKLVKTYKESGVDAVVITNHFIGKYISNKESISSYMKDFYEAVDAGKKYGVKVILGMELRFENENLNDYLIYGIDEDFVKKTSDYLGKTLKEFRKDMKNEKNIIIQAHPFRNDMVLMDSFLIDGAETFNMHPGHNSRNAFALEYANKNPDFIVTAGSDYHHPGHHATGLILSKKLPENSFEFAEILKSKDYIFSLCGYAALPYFKK